MPIYEYKCNACGNRFEKLFKSIEIGIEKKNMTCPVCGAESSMIFSRYSAPGTVKQWLGKNEVNFDVDTPKAEIEKQLAAASKAGHFDNDVAPHLKSERIRVGKEALKTAVDIKLPEGVD